MSIAYSPNMKLLYGLDESGATAIRKNAGAAGSDMDLETWNKTTSDGCPVSSDGKGGKAASFKRNPGGTWTNEKRNLVLPTSKVNGAVTNLPYPGATGLPWATLFNGSTGTGVTFSARIKTDLYTGGTGGNDHEHIIGFYVEDNLEVSRFTLALRHDRNTSPVNGAYVRITDPMGNVSHNVIDGISSWVSYGDAIADPDAYIVKDHWYTILVRVSDNNDASTVTMDVWLFEEATGKKYKIKSTAEARSGWIAWAANFLDGSLEITFGLGGCRDTGTDHFGLNGPCDQVFIYEGVLSDDEAETVLVGGIDIPWSEPDYRCEDHVVHVAVAGDGQDFPKTRPLPTGGLAPRFPLDVRCQRARFRYEGWRPGRPWCLRNVQGVFDTAGPFNARREYPFHLDDPNAGLWRTPGELPSGAWEDVRNVECTEVGPRRRRGFKVIRDVDDTYQTGANAFFSFRNYADALHICYKVGASLYAETGAGAVEIDTGWALHELPVFLFLDDRAIILSATKRVSWRGNTDDVDTFGADAPASISAVAGAGGTLIGDYYYAATLYDSNTGDETAPVILSAVVSPSTQKVTLTLPGATAIPDSRFNYYRIYRTNDGGSAPNLFYIASVAVSGAASMTYDDTGEPDGTVAVGRVMDADGNLLGYLTMTLPDTFSLGCTHMERAFYSGGETYPERIYVTEQNENQRFYDAYWLVADGGPVRAVASWGHRFVVFTDSTVEIFESDWIRDAMGDVNIQRTVTSRSVGALGPHSVVDVRGQLKWMDHRSLWENPANPTAIGDPQVQDLVPYLNHGISNRVVAGYNHVRRQVWWSVPQAHLQEDNTRFQTIYVQHLARSDRWTLYEMEASFHGEFDYDLQGLVYGVMDHLGVMKWQETYEGDGAEGDESWTTEDEGTDDYSGSPAGILSIVGTVVTAYGSPGWTTDALRGMGVVLRDRSTGGLHQHLIVSNTADTFTTARTPDSDLVAGDGYYIGGIRSYLEYAGQRFGSPNEKIIRQVQTQFVALTGSRYL